MSTSVNMNSTISNYTYDYKKQLQPKLDKDNDSKWSRTEVQNYANSYKKATGTTLDVDKIMKTYAGEDGTISVENQAKMRDADALGLSKLTEAKSTTKPISSGKEFNVNELMESMSSNTKARFTRSMNKSESMSKMLNNFNSVHSSGNMFGMSNIISQKNVANLYSSQMKYGTNSAYQNMASQMMSIMA